MGPVHDGSLQRLGIPARQERSIRRHEALATPASAPGRER
jgi:hypothetical protein